jgi:hypothetical protein
MEKSNVTIPICPYRRLYRRERHIVCTDEADMGSLIQDLQALSPKLQIGVPDHQHQVAITNPELVAVRFWIVDWLCRHGWEPFGHFEDIYDFRRASER